MLRINKIPQSILLTEYVSNYDLIVIACNDMMEPINEVYMQMLEKFNIKKIYKRIKKKYHLDISNPIEDGEIRVISGSNTQSDIMFIKFPYKNKDVSRVEFLKVYNSIFDNINLNEYKKVLMPDEKTPFRCGFSTNETNDINLNICSNAFELVKDENTELHIPIIF